MSEVPSDFARANRASGAQHDHAAARLELTILMPCLNEAETLAVCIEKASAFLDRSGIDRRDSDRRQWQHGRLGRNRPRARRARN